MAKAITLPKLGLTMEEATVVVWMKKEGEHVAKKDVLLVVETDKSSLDIEAEEEGLLKEIVVKEGEIAPVGTILAYLESDQNVRKESPNEIVQNHMTNVNPHRSNRLRTSPSARKLAREHDIDLESIKEVGTYGRIVRSDIRKIIAEKEAQTQTNVAAAQGQHFYSSKRKPVSQMRKVIAKRMTKSVQQAPQFHIRKAVDMTKLLSIQQTLTKSIKASIGVKLSVNDFLIQAVARSLKKHPWVNASFIEDEEDIHILEHEHINIGLAVAIEQGLVVPVIIMS